MSSGPIVLDASYALALVMHDEAPPASATSVLATSLIAPAIWQLEMANAMISNVRRRRLTQMQVPNVFAAVEQLDVEVFPVPVAAASHWYHFSSQHGLTPYDAQYLDLALQNRCAIATCDAAIAKAAARLGVAVFG